jgi:hypothetical protein
MAEADPAPAPPPVPAEAVVQAIVGAFNAGGVADRPAEEILREIAGKAMMRVLVKRGTQRIHRTLQLRR